MNVLEVKKLVSGLISIPKDYEIANYHAVNHDNSPVIHARFTKNSNKMGGLFTEHFSVTVDKENNHLMGVIHLDKDFDTNNYIDENNAEKVALNFIKKHAKDLLDAIEIRWIRPTRKVPQSPPHDEGFQLGTGEIITGMRVKLWANDTKKYAWVIVGEHGQIINFERDVVWSTLKHKRTTEKWLHDSWLEEKNIDLPCLPE